MLSEILTFIGTILGLFALVAVIWFLRRDISDVPGETEEVLRLRDQEIFEEDQIKTIIHEMQAFRKDFISWYGADQASFAPAWAERIQDFERKYPEELVEEAEFRLSTMDSQHFALEPFSRLKKI